MVQQSDLENSTKKYKFQPLPHKPKKRVDPMYFLGSAMIFVLLGIATADKPSTLEEKCANNTEQSSRHSTLPIHPFAVLGIAGSVAGYFVAKQLKKYD